MVRLNWGIIATGWIADLFTRDLIANGHSVTAVASRSQHKASEFAARFDIATAHGSYEALAADNNVDLVYIATPHPFHVIAAELCISAGKHVLVEKPFTLNAPQAYRVKSLAQTHGVFVMEAMWTRFLPHMVSLREVLASGVIGDIRSLVATHTQDLPADPGHRLNDLSLGGGALLDLGVYPISFAFDLLGKPETILASGRLRETGADAEASMIFRYASGAVALLLSASDAPGANRAEINGSAGHVELDGVWYSPTSYRIYASNGELQSHFGPAKFKGRGMHFQAVEFERLVSQGEMSSPVMSIDQSIEIMETMDEIRRQIGVKYPDDLRASQERGSPQNPG